MASDMYLKLDGVEGESKDDKHKNWIEVLSFSTGVANAHSNFGAGGAGVGKAQFQEIHVTAAIDKAAPTLFMKCATGEHIKKLELVARKSGGDQVEYAKFELEDVFVTNVQFAGADGQGTVTMNYSFSGAKIKHEYWPQDEKGTQGAAVKVGYDIKAHKKV